jgi:hypothetical protein
VVAVLAVVAVVAQLCVAAVAAVAAGGAAAAHAGDGAAFAKFHDLTDERQNLTNDHAADRGVCDRLERARSWMIPVSALG